MTLCYVAVAIASMLCLEMFLRIPFVARVKTLLAVYKKIFSVLLSRRISDHWKEVVILRYAITMVTLSFGLTMWMLGMCVLTFIPLLAFSHVSCNGLSVWQSLLEIDVLLVSALVCVAYYYMRKKMGIRGA